MAAFLTVRSTSGRVLSDVDICRLLETLEVDRLGLTVSASAVGVLRTLVTAWQKFLC